MAGAMTALVVGLVVVPVVDLALKALLVRTLGAGSLSLGALGRLRMREAPIWLHVGANRERAGLWRVWFAAAGALVLAAAALPLPGWSIGLLLGGSISHALETSRRGYVWDYVELRGSPAFDLADVALVIGAGGTLMALVAATLDRLVA